jgi:hypothetical protein
MRTSFGGIRKYGSVIGKMIMAFVLVVTISGVSTVWAKDHDNWGHNKKRYERRHDNRRPVYRGYYDRYDNRRPVYRGYYDRGYYNHPYRVYAPPPVVYAPPPPPWGISIFAPPIFIR